jgi:hypothetical protein
MFFPLIERPKGLSMKTGYSFMSKLKLIENKTLRQRGLALTYELAK